MPEIHKIPKKYLKKNIEQYFTEEDFIKCFPYYKASSVFTHDNTPFWTYKYFIQAIDWLNSHENNIYHGFGTSSDNDLINLLEISAFLGNFHQECGDPSLEAPYPWGWPKPVKKNKEYEGPAGGALAILEGANCEVVFGVNNEIIADLKGPKLELSLLEKEILQVSDPCIQGIVRTLAPLNQPQFGLGLGAGNGAVFQEGLVAVSDNGTMWGDVNLSKYTKDPTKYLGDILPAKDYLQLQYTNRKYASLGPYSQYGGRGAIQLSYNYNYTDCSIALFADFRLVKYPNLIITTDRKNFNGNSYYFGFPGPNEKGNNQLPKEIEESTPPAQVLAWLVCFWFWMDPNRSGRKISCHQAMVSPFEIGITTVNAIINNQSGLKPGSWASKKIDYYFRVGKILGIDQETLNKSIVSPPNPLSLLKL